MDGMKNHGYAAGVPCGVCGLRIDHWFEDIAEPCGHSYEQIITELAYALNRKYTPGEKAHD